jgi:hypothetical protein
MALSKRAAAGEIGRSDHFCIKILERRRGRVWDAVREHGRARGLHERTALPAIALEGFGPARQGCFARQHL